METYVGISDQYDLLMQGGYFDHEGKAASLSQLLRPRVLEIGVGTGLFAEKLASFGWEITGIDHTEAMIRHARNRLGDSTAVGGWLRSNLSGSEGAPAHEVRKAGL